jgi:hypothetical protein
MRLVLLTLVRWFIVLDLVLLLFIWTSIGASFSPWIQINEVPAFILAGALAWMLIVAGESTARCLVLLRFYWNPEEVKSLIEDLDSPSHHKRCLAVRTVMDVLGRRCRGADDWPFSGFPQEQLGYYAALLKKWWTLRQSLPAPLSRSHERHLRRISREIQSTYWGIAALDLKWTPRWLPASLRRQIAQVTEIRVPGAPLQPLSPSRLLQAMQFRISETLLRVSDVINGSEPGSIIAQSERRVGELFVQLIVRAYHIGLFLRMESSLSELPKGIVAICFEEPRPSLWLEFLQDCRRAVQKAWDAVNVALMDFDLRRDPYFEKPYQVGVPAMPAEAFMRVMAGKVEQALTDLAEILNDSWTGQLDLVGETAVCLLFAQLEVQALETGFELRWQQAEKPSLPEVSPTKERFRLRTAANPPLPAGEMGWAEKYRCMSIPGTRYPLMHERMEAN